MVHLVKFGNMYAGSVNRSMDTILKKDSHTGSNDDIYERLCGVILYLNKLKFHFI